MTTKEGELIGYEVDLAKKHGIGHGLSGPKWRSCLLPNCCRPCRSGKIDLILSNMTITPARNLKVAFVGPYFTSGKSIS